MKPHTWTTEEVDGGYMGSCDFWECSACGAGGGVVWPHQPVPPQPKHIFLANGSGLELPADCDVAKVMIIAFKAGYGFAFNRIPPKVRTRFKIPEAL